MYFLFKQAEAVFQAHRFFKEACFQPLKFRKYISLSLGLSYHNFSSIICKEPHQSEDMIKVVLQNVDVEQVGKQVSCVLYEYFSLYVL